VTQFRVVGDGGRWSGGGTGLLGLFAYAAERHLILKAGPGAIPVHVRNVPARLRNTRRPYVLVPQNAWPWQARGAVMSELPRVVALRLGSEVFMRAATAVMRISSAIPVIGAVNKYSPVIHNVLDPDFERALSAADCVDSSPAKGRVLVVGSCYSYRNLERVIAAHSSSGDSRELLICGPLGNRNVAHRVAQAAIDTPRVHVRWGSLPRPTCLAYMRAADTVVLPSLVEASPFSLLEAFAVQPRVVVSDIAAHRDVIGDVGCPASVFPARSTEVLARRLAAVEASKEVYAVLADPQQREERRERWAHDVANWLEHVAQRYEGSRR
jgi:glycosyltransferase involved in cell wall biosynthesis